MSISFPRICGFCGLFLLVIAYSGAVQCVFVVFLLLEKHDLGTEEVTF